MFKKGFTILEVLIVVAILVILVAIAVPAYHIFLKGSDLNSSTEEIISILRLAQVRTLSSENDSSWGVYFSTSTVPHQYTLFQGLSYVSREPLADEVYQVSKSIEIESMSVAGGGNEIVFDRIVGTTAKFGQISLRIISDPSQTRDIYIDNSGRAGFNILSSPSDDDRVKDSRHVHFNYTREIATLTEDLILTFEGFVVATIVINDNLKNNQIYWKGQVDVGGEIQNIQIETHRLNDILLGSQFSVYRERSHNNKSLRIELSGDATGFLIDYSADGLTTTKTSINATNPDWQ
ncbi:MAG: prepilin-type N-terminal cleavage/methylation domain-containing protein [Candidatus Nealsonbacteria bacterium]